MIETLAEGTRKARTTHTCALCYRTIDPGENYHYQRNVYDGQIYTWKECAHCDAMRRLINFYDWWGDADEGGIGHDEVQGYEPTTIAEARLIIGWRGKWRRKDGTLREVPEVAE